MDIIAISQNIFNADNLIGFLDILFISIFIYLFLLLFQHSKAKLIIFGIVILSFIYILAKELNLVLTSAFLQTFFAVIIIAILIIFQDEIKRFFEQIAIWSLNPKWKSNKSKGSGEIEVNILCDVLNDLASQRIGALIVLPGSTSISGYIDGGEPLDGRLSEALLKSIFDPHSAGHDGAVVIENNIVKMFGAHLPLSNNFSQLKNRGTRHAAALGLAEATNALCLVVSEERGAISIAKDGSLTQVNADQLQEEIHNYYVLKKPQERKIANFIFIRNFRIKIISLLLAILLWFVFVYESKLIYKSFDLPVTYASLLGSSQIENIEPDKIKITFLGAKRDFYFLSEDELNVILKIPDTEPGTHVVGISASDISFPDSLSVERIEPEELTVIIDKKIEPRN